MSRLASNTGVAPEQLLNGRYEAVEVISGGEWGQTYIAVDTYRPGNPECVVKQLRPVSEQPDCLKAARHLFEYESNSLRRLGSHNQIVQLLDCLEVEQAFYLVQEFIRGYPLSSEVLPNERWRESQVVQLLQEVLEILVFIHSQGIIHGEIQPDNLIRRQEDGKLVLTDFSAIKRVRVPLSTPQEQVSAIASPGALEYLSLEQVRGKPRPSSDIYSLGIIAIQALTGLHPVQFEEDSETGEIIWEKKATVRGELAAILSRMVRYHFKDRYQSATEVLEALQALDNPAPAIPLAVSSPRLDTPPSEVDTTPDTASNPAEQSDEPSTSSFSKKIMIGTAGVATAGVATSLVLAVGAGTYLIGAPAEPFKWFDYSSKTLAQAAEKYQAGDYQEAVVLAESISAKSEAYQEAQSAIAQWQKDWQNAQAQFRVIEKAFAARQWQEVVEQARQTPPIIHWEQKIDPLVQQAQANLEVEAYQLLQQAYNQAINNNFTGALNILKQIHRETKVYPKVQAKIAEYTEKRRLKANTLLDKAYNRAANKDFTSALTYLRQVPKATPAYAQARKKIQEYSRKQRLQANYLVQRAYNRAALKDFTGALKFLRQVPEDTPAYAKVPEKILEYTEKQRLKGATGKAKPSTAKAPSKRPFRLEPFTNNSFSNQSSFDELFPGRVPSSPQRLDPGSRLQEVVPQTPVVPRRVYSTNGE